MLLHMLLQVVLMAIKKPRSATDRHLLLVNLLWVSAALQTVGTRVTKF